MAGGFAAMGYYRGALAIPTVLENTLSPSTTADLQATFAILRSLDSAIAYTAAKLNLAYSIFAEELEQPPANELETEREKNVKESLGKLGDITPHIRRTSEDFRETFNTSIAILFDALDGTTNFRAGIPLFCSAVAFFIGGEPRVGAIYDPLHNVVYYGSLRIDGRKCRRHAYAWQVQSGSLTDLTKTEKFQSPEKLIATHLTRSIPEKRNELLKKLALLTTASEGTYMLNSGQLALAYIANGLLSAFINNYTNIWDVAAGEVLVRAVGGKVTNFAGKDINYGQGSKVDVIATTSETLHQEIMDTLNS